MKHLHEDKNQSPNEFNQPASIHIVMNQEVAEIIQNCIKHNIFYGVFPVVGDGMTCNDERSITDGSGVLVFDLQLDMLKPLSALMNDIPINEPITIALYTDSSEYTYFVDTISFIDAVNNRIKLCPYNPSPKYGGWVSFDRIHKIYKVVQVIDKETFANRTNII